MYQRELSVLVKKPIQVDAVIKEPVLVFHVRNTVDQSPRGTNLIIKELIIRVMLQEIELHLIPIYIAIQAHDEVLQVLLLHLRYDLQNSNPCSAHASTFLRRTCV